MALTDQEYANHAARHGYGDENAPRQATNKVTGKTRQQEFADAGVKSQKDAASLTYQVRTASDTKCFRGAKGNEEYANDRLNAYHIANAEKPHRSTIFPNNDPNRSATQRLEERAAKEREATGAPCKVREGGSKALEQDRQAERQRAAAEKKQAAQDHAQKQQDQKATAQEKTALQREEAQAKQADRAKAQEAAQEQKAASRDKAEKPKPMEPVLKTAQDQQRTSAGEL